MYTNTSYLLAVTLAALSYIYIVFPVLSVLYSFNTDPCTKCFSLYLDKPMWCRLITSISLTATGLCSLHSKSAMLENGYGLGSR